MWRKRRSFKAVQKLQQRLCSGKTTQDTKHLAKTGEKGLGKKTHDKKFVYASTTDDGESNIMFKHNPPDDPRAHQEGEILDFTDGVDHAFKKNPFGNLIKEAKAGEIEGVRPLSMGLPGNRSKSMYGFDRGTKHELTNYGQSASYISDEPEEIDAAHRLMLANARLPGFDETRESIYDKYALRRSVEQRNLRLLERDALLHERKMAEVHNQIQVDAADDLRRVVVKDAVMQNPYKWLSLKHNEQQECLTRQGEDVFFSNRMMYTYTIVAFCVCIAVVLHRSLEDGSLDNTAVSASGELASISGYTERAASLGSYQQVGEMYRYQDMVSKHVARMEGNKISISHLRASESFQQGSM